MPSTPDRLPPQGPGWVWNGSAWVNPSMPGGAYAGYGPVSSWGGGAQWNQPSANPRPGGMYGIGSDPNAPPGTTMYGIPFPSGDNYAFANAPPTTEQWNAIFGSAALPAPSSWPGFAFGNTYTAIGAGSTSNTGPGPFDIWGTGPRPMPQALGV